MTKRPPRRRQRHVPKEERDRYNAYLRSPEWGALRQEVIARYQGRCVICRTTKGLQVHHKTYARLYDELVSDLMLVCVDCHDGLHGKWSRVGKRAARKAIEDRKALVCQYKIAQSFIGKRSDTVALVS